MANFHVVDILWHKTGNRRNRTAHWTPIWTPECISLLRQKWPNHPADSQQSFRPIYERWDFCWQFC